MITLALSFIFIVFGLPILFIVTILKAIFGNEDKANKSKYVNKEDKEYDEWGFTDYSKK